MVIYSKKYQFLDWNYGCRHYVWQFFYFYMTLNRSKLTRDCIFKKKKCIFAMF